MKSFKVKDRVSSPEGNGTVVSIVYCDLFRKVYYVELDNGKREFFPRWYLKKVK